MVNKIHVLLCALPEPFLRVVSLMGHHTFYYHGSWSNNRACLLSMLLGIHAVTELRFWYYGLQRPNR